MNVGMDKQLKKVAARNEKNEKGETVVFVGVYREIVEKDLSDRYYRVTVAQDTARFEKIGPWDLESAYNEKYDEKTDEFIAPESKGKTAELKKSLSQAEERAAAAEKKLVEIEAKYREMAKVK